MNAAVARLEPQTPRAAAGLMREAVRDGFRVGVRGGGTNGPGAFNVDAVLETRGMRRIVEYAPEDQTVSVEAGITFAELQRALALHGQRLIVESAQPERATIGGAIAANVFGPRRLTYGTLKDLILGVGLVRADGVEAHAGGKVVKNVAGFDLSKLMVGSFGTLAVVTAATLRVHPLAERTRAFRVAELAPGEVWSLVIALRKALLEPAAVIAHRDPERARYDVDVLFEGFAVGVAAKVDAFAALAASEGRRFAERDAIGVERTDAAVRAAEPLRFRASTPPAEFAAVDEAVIAPLLAALAGGVCRCLSRAWNSLYRGRTSVGRRYCSAAGIQSRSCRTARRIDRRRNVAAASADARTLGHAACVFCAHATTQSTFRSGRPAEPRFVHRRIVMTLSIGGEPARTTTDLISDCVHCGFCLPACPTYASWGDEMDSPRGRIDLMKGLDTGVIVLDDRTVAHFDQCLGCMACVTACPSGVRYDLLIESTRATIEHTYPRTLSDKLFRELIFALFPYPGRLRLAALPLGAYVKTGVQGLVRRLRLTRFLPARFAQLEALTPPVVKETKLQAFYPATTKIARARVALIAGCVQRVFFPNVNDATIRVLTAEGCDVVVPQQQGCCGALSLHSGRDVEAKRFAAALIEAFERERVDAIIINAAGCGSTLKEYAELFAADDVWRERARAFSDKVSDINEYLAALEPVAVRKPIARRVAYHDACHLAHAQRIRSQPRALLGGIPGLELIEIPDGEQCCGSAGTYNLFQPKSALEIGERKVDNILSTAPTLLASANPGCTLQIQSVLRQRNIELRAAHPIEILDASINGVPLPA